MVRSVNAEGSGDLILPVDSGDKVEQGSELPDPKGEGAVVWPPSVPWALALWLWCSLNAGACVHSRKQPDKSLQVEGGRSQGFAVTRPGCGAGALVDVGREPAMAVPSSQPRTHPFVFWDLCPPNICVLKP